MFHKVILKPFLENIEKNPNRNVFCIAKVLYTYHDLAENISKIRKALQELKPKNKHIGLIANDDIETYASIFAIWLEGLAYVPMNPETPKERNENVIKQAGIEIIIDSSENQIFTNYSVINSKQLQETEINLTPIDVSDHDLAYILFTSGTTGTPKGVPITRSNLYGFVISFDKLGLNISDNDNFLQMFDLTFDLSVMSYLIPLIKGDLKNVQGINC